MENAPQTIAKRILGICTSNNNSDDGEGTRSTGTSLWRYLKRFKPIPMEHFRFLNFKLSDAYLETLGRERSKFRRKSKGTRSRVVTLRYQLSSCRVMKLISLARNVHSCQCQLQEIWNNILFVRLDGTLNQQQREKVLKQFSEDSSIMVMLMSLKSGGVGINLTAASNAFVMDPWWNPAVEEQAVMRIHRIEQTKEVKIRRFIIKGTVEERMEAVQARKQRKISGALTDKEVQSARLEELKMLFT